MIFAGLDVSTQSCKIVVIDQQKNEIMTVESVNYDRDLPEFQTLNGVIRDKESGISESDPSMWINLDSRILVTMRL